jgi:hypothetical protein
MFSCMAGFPLLLQLRGGGVAAHLRVLRLHCGYALLWVAMGCYVAPKHAMSCFMPIACFPVPQRSF